MRFGNAQIGIIVLCWSLAAAAEVSAQAASCVIKRCVRNSDGYILFDDLIQSSRQTCSGSDRSERVFTVGHGYQALLIQRFPQTGDKARCVNSTSQTCGDRPTEPPGATPIISIYPEFDGISSGEYQYALSSGNNRYVCNDGVFRRGYSSSPALSNPALIRDITKFESGLKRACLLTSSGVVRCAGDNLRGQLGIGTRGAERYGLTTVPAVGTNAVDLALSDNHTCALLKSGEISCWGDNEFGQLGSGKRKEEYPKTFWNYDSYETSPVTVRGIPAGERIRSIGVGHSHSCALSESGGVWCWGRNAKGQLGNGTLVDTPSPTRVSLKPSEPARALAVRGDQSCAIVTTGNLTKAVCWGETFEPYIDPITKNPRQRLKASSSPLEYRPFFRPATRIELQLTQGEDSLGRLVETNHLGCVRTLDRQSNFSHGECFNGPYRNSPSAEGSQGFLISREQHGVTPSQPAGKQIIDVCPVFTSFIGPQLVKSVSRNCCGLLESGEAACPSRDQFFGKRELNSLGNFFFLGKAFNDPDPGGAAPSAIKQIVGQGLSQQLVTDKDTCVLLDSGEVGCAGPGVEGGRDPKPVTALGATSLKLSAGEGFFCALSKQGTISCWGRNDRRQLGNGSRVASPTPVQVTGLPTPAREIVSGKFVSCALIGNDVHCWGNDSAPRKISGLPATAPLSLVSETERMCALFTGGAVWCWENLEPARLITNAEPTAQKLALLKNGLIAYMTSAGLVGLRNPSGTTRQGYTNPTVIPEVNTSTNEESTRQPRIRDLFSNGMYLVGVTLDGRAVHYDALLAPGLTHQFFGPETMPRVNTIFPLPNGACFSTPTGAVLCRLEFRGRELLNPTLYGRYSTAFEVYPGSHRAPPLSITNPTLSNPSEPPPQSGVGRGNSGDALAPQPPAQSSTAPGAEGRQQPPVVPAGPGNGAPPAASSPASSSRESQPPRADSRPAAAPATPTVVAIAATPTRVAQTPTPPISATATPVSVPPTATPPTAAPAERSPRDGPACSDGEDNDGDGLRDIMDIGCESATDQTEDDDGVSSTLTISLEGLFDRGDGTFDAYLSYRNPGKKTVSIPVGETATTKNYFSPGEPNQGQPIEFRRGEHRGVLRVPFRGDPLTWTLKAPGAVEQSISISSESMKLKPVEPLATCISTTSSGQISAVLGYLNPNPFDISVPVGTLNNFSPGAADRSQPTLFFSGLNTGVLALPIDTVVTWKLASRQAVVSPSTTVCECPAAKNSAPKSTVNESSTTLGEQLFAALSSLDKVSDRRFKTASSDDRRKLRESFESIGRQAAKRALDVERAVKKLPDESRACVEPPAGCRLIDDGPKITVARRRLASSLAMVTRIVRRINFLRGSEAAGDRELLQNAITAHDNGVKALDEIPRFRTVCD